MPVTKLGQASHNELSDLRQKHFDLDIRIGEVLNSASLDIKGKIVARLPGLIDEINAEMKQRENDIGI